MAIEDNKLYSLSGSQLKDLASRINAGGSGGGLEFVRTLSFPSSAIYQHPTLTVITSGIFKVDETSDGSLVQFRNATSYRCNVQSTVTVNLSQISGTSYYGLKIGEITYHPSRAKVYTKCYSFFNGAVGEQMFSSFVSEFKNYCEKYYLPLIINTSGEVFVFCQEADPMSETVPSYTLGNFTNIIDFGNILIDVKNGGDVI